MKKLIFVACLLLVSIPLCSGAQGGQGQNQGGQGQNQGGQGQNCQGQGRPCTNRRISATEMGAVGSGVAVLLGLAGYLVLRRSKPA